MALTPSNIHILGSKAPAFELPDVVSGNQVSLDDIKSDKATVVMFICNHCPFVVHVRDELVKLANDYIPKGVSFVAISSNDIVNYPDDAPDKMRDLALSEKFPFPYLYDESQSVAKAYDAACTPDFFVYNGEMKSVYQGRLDDSRPGNGIPVTGKDIRAALDNILSGNQVSRGQQPSMGCNIKWKAS